MEKYIQIKTIFESNKNDIQAEQMSKYMRNQFTFYRIKAPVRKSLCKDFLKAEKQTSKIDWDFLDLCYKDEHREFSI